MASADTHHRDALSVAFFDLDGTLLDTPTAIATHMSAAVETVTGRRPAVEHARQLIGTPLGYMAATLAGVDEGSSIAEDVAAQYLTRFREIIVPSAADLVFPGVQEGLVRLRDAGVVNAIVTSKNHQSAESILEAAGIRHHFDAIVGADDVDHPKPHRDSADRALSILGRSGVGPADAVIGDTASDIGLGVAIGARTIGVTYGVASHQQITDAAPDAIAAHFDHVTDILLALTESEPAP